LNGGRNFFSLPFIECVQNDFVHAPDGRA
jgi:hypothetical protein